MGTTIRISNAEFGRRIGVGHSMASRIRSGQRVPSTGRILRIHEEFGLPLDELMAAAASPAAFASLLGSKLKPVDAA